MIVYGSWNCVIAKLYLNIAKVYVMKINDAPKFMEITITDPTL